MGTDKMKILPVLALASAHAYTVFEVNAVCDVDTTPCTGVNEWCTADKTCDCVPGYPSADGKSCAETIAEKCDDKAALCPAGSTCDAATGVCDCSKADGCAEGTCDHFCNAIPVVETTAAVTTPVPETGTTVADNSTTAAPEGGSAMSYSLAVSTLITLLLA